ncbi:YeiH family protein [Kordiimonas aestuarii]|uniref:YeiH family protein n=1 Tax=Kordiimonas aestuarii TaxID=1005925 RepID=UPI0021D19D69|nr:putative sulfate exporter family transporter [Kordiimonas aestuarii]
MVNSTKERIATIFPGFIISLTVGLAASFLGEHYGAPAMLFALLLGMALHFVHDDPKCQPGIAFTSSTVLRIGVALLGLRIALADVMALGWQTFVLMAVGIVTSILFGLLVARLFGLKRRFGALTGGAVAICGASAALALSAVMPKSDEQERDTVFAVVGVTALSTVAMIIYPMIGGLVGMTDAEAGIFIGATIHDVAQVVGAGYSISAEAGDLAALTKLMRVAMLLPVVLAFVLVFRTYAQADDGAKKPPILPGFLVAFVVFVLINSAVTIPAEAKSVLTTFSRTCLITAIAAIGLKSNLRSIATLGWRPVMLMVVETIWLAGLVLLCLPITEA